jgi:hypothetical protein
MVDIPDFETLLNGDPVLGFSIIMDDLTMRLKQQGVKPNSLKGIHIAMQIAYRLGERAGALAVLKDE